MKEPLPQTPTQTPNPHPQTGEKKEILVVVTGEGCDHEVLALARRFLLLPDVTVTLCVVEVCAWVCVWGL